VASDFLTPPYGINLFVTMAEADLTMEEMFRHILWFFRALCVTLAITTCGPQTPLFPVYLLK